MRMGFAVLLQYFQVERPFLKPTYDIARELYRRLLNRMPIGRAVQEACTVIKPAGDPNWLA